jgi:chromosome segregation ATPase
MGAYSENNESLPRRITNLVRTEIEPALQDAMKSCREVRGDLITATQEVWARREELRSMETDIVNLKDETRQQRGLLDTQEKTVQTLQENHKTLQTPITQDKTRFDSDMEQMRIALRNLTSRIDQQTIDHRNEMKSLRAEFDTRLSTTSGKLIDSSEACMDVTENTLKRHTKNLDRDHQRLNMHNERLIALERMQLPRDEMHSYVHDKLQGFDNRLDAHAITPLQEDISAQTQSIKY